MESSIWPPFHSEPGALSKRGKGVWPFEAYPVSREEVRMAFQASFPDGVYVESSFEAEVHGRLVEVLQLFLGLFTFGKKVRGVRF